MLLEIGIGDAYGAGFEFSPMEKVVNLNNLTAYQPHELGIAPGHYTDDTQMSLAIAELIISEATWSHEVIANKFVECFKRDERKGYSKGFFKFLQSIENGSEFLGRINPNSARNGAAMRAAPIGIISNIDDVLAMSEIQASITHNTVIGIKSSQAVSLIAHYFIYSLGDKSSVCEYVSDLSQHKWNDDWNEQVACCGEQTVNALLTTLRQSKNLHDILINSVAFGGDVDTVAALALGIAHSNTQYTKKLPGFLYQNLENGNYGKQYLKNIGDTLMQLKRPSSQDVTK